MELQQLVAVGEDAKHGVKGKKELKRWLQAQFPHRGEVAKVFDNDVEHGNNA